MALVWKVREFLEAHGVSAYRLMKEAGLSQGTAYRLANNDANGVHLETLDTVLSALERLTGKRISLQDIIEQR